ncbi:hypothetical protein [Lysobacter sp. TAB13]|uniref:hypothetical protein n=1 Tax=Lysobacter sp. TAB13 TaxID=3233065 RepID=UPI003F9C3215
MKRITLAPQRGKHPFYAFDLHIVVEIAKFRLSARFTVQFPLAAMLAASRIGSKMRPASSPPSLPVAGYSGISIQLLRGSHVCHSNPICPSAQY